MWRYTYGQFGDQQVAATKDTMRKQIYYLLLCVDPSTKNEYKYVDVNAAFDGTMRQFAGLNDLLGEPAELVRIQQMLKAAQNEYNSPTFEWREYRKLILSAGSMVLKIKED